MVKALALEAATADCPQSPQAELLSSGHLALEACIRAMGVTGEAIATLLMFASTMQALVRCGVTPGFAELAAQDICTRKCFIP